MTAKRIIGLLLALSLIFVGCKEKSSSRFKVFRLIDHLESENIKKSPLFEVRKQSENPASFYPLKSNPLTDLGTGENPIEIKRKLKLGGTEFNIIFAPANSEYSFECDISENSKLAFGTGLLRDQNSD
ncbi:MAG: hypothetical protein ACOC57_07510, partial [Acidobacteriota bacterium]